MPVVRHLGTVGQRQGQGPRVRNDPFDHLPAIDRRAAPIDHKQEGEVPGIRLVARHDHPRRPRPIRGRHGRSGPRAGLKDQAAQLAHRPTLREQARQTHSWSPHRHRPTDQQRQRRAGHCLRLIAAFTGSATTHPAHSSWRSIPAPMS